MLEVGLDEVVRLELEALDSKLIEGLRECHDLFDHWMSQRALRPMGPTFADAIDHYMTDIGLDDNETARGVMNTTLLCMACMQIGVKPEYLHLDIICTVLRLCVGDVPTRYHVAIWDVLRELLPSRIDSHTSDTIMDAMATGFDSELGRFIDDELHRNY